MQPGEQAAARSAARYALDNRLVRVGQGVWAAGCVARLVLVADPGEGDEGVRAEHGNPPLGSVPVLGAESVRHNRIIQIAGVRVIGAGDELLLARLVPRNDR
jgi:hypothetical protein